MRILFRRILFGVSWLELEVCTKQKLQHKIIHKLYGRFCCNLYFVRLQVVGSCLGGSC